MSKLAQQLIAENIKNQNPRLDLGNCGLTELPEGLAELEWVEELILSPEWHPTHWTAAEQAWHRRSTLL